MSSNQRLVFDCTVLLQSLISPTGPAKELLGAVKELGVSLFVSDYVLMELRDVALRPKLKAKYLLTEEIVDAFCTDLLRFATHIETIPHVYDMPRDPDDAHYVDLAVATNSKLMSLATKICCP